jgi:CubicO group peptidase (beta-lactamase class C family)
MTQTSRRDFLKTTSFAAAGVVAVPGPTLLSDVAGPAKAAGSVTELEAWLIEAIDRHKIPGASVAIYHKGELQAAAAGITNNTTQVPVDTRTVMHIGSITKIFNTTLVMQLVDDGLVELDGPVIEYLPQWRVSSGAATRAITVKMLLNHTSGIDGELLPDFGPDRERVEDAIPRFAAMGQKHAPGQDTSYCNTAHCTAGYLVQRMRRESWYTIIERDIFERLELGHSVVQPADALLHRASVGHFMDAAAGELTRTSHAFLPESFAPAGATAMLSASDLARFAVAHLRDGEGLNGARLLSPESARLMRVPTSHMKGYGSTLEFGLGWMLSPGDTIGHGGGGPGILAGLTAVPERDYAIAVLTNAAHGSLLIQDANSTWGQTIAGIEPEAPADYPFIDSRVDARRYIGVFEDIAAKMEVVEHEGGIGLASTSKGKFYDSVSLERGPVVPLKPVAQDVFGFAAPGAVSSPAALSFVNPGADGRPGHIAMGARLYKRST